MKMPPVDFILEGMEILVNPDIGLRKWQVTRETNSHGIDVWYISPKPYKYGFATALSESAAREQHRTTATSTPVAARAIIWC